MDDTANNDNIDGGGGENNVFEANETLGEWDVIVSNDVVFDVIGENDSGGLLSCQNLQFESRFGLQIRIVGVDLVESIDKRLSDEADSTSTR